MTVSQINKKKFVTRGIFFIKKIRLFEILDKNPTIIFRENIDYLAIQDFFDFLKIQQKLCIFFRFVNIPFKY